MWLERMGWKEEKREGLNQESLLATSDQLDNIENSLEIGLSQNGIR